MQNQVSVQYHTPKTIHSLQIYEGKVQLQFQEYFRS